MKKVTLLTSLICLATGCSLFNTEPFVDTHQNKDGQLVLSDTPRNWEFFKDNVDFRIQNELEGKRPEAGAKTWNEFWQQHISNQNSGRENREKYINYIIEARRVQGLPNLQ